MDNNIPMFKKADLARMRSHPDTSLDVPEYEDFLLFLEQAIETEIYENDTEEGVIKYTIDNGTSPLSEKQLWTINSFVNRELKSCSRCEEVFSFMEMTSMEGDFCSYCQYQWDKLDD